MANEAYHAYWSIEGDHRQDLVRFLKPVFRKSWFRSRLTNRTGTSVEYNHVSVAQDFGPLGGEHSIQDGIENSLAFTDINLHSNDEDSAKRTCASILTLIAHNKLKVKTYTPLNIPTE